MLIVFILYLAILLAITGLTAFRSKNAADYIMGGRKIGGVSLAISERATGESAWLLLGLTGEAYALGMQAIWIALGCVLGILFIWFVMGNRLRMESERTGAMTISSLMTRRFPGSGKTIGLVSSLIIVFFFLFYIEAQFYGGGKVLHDTFGIDPLWGVVVGSLLVVFYSMVGGFITVVFTDVFQGILMIITLIVMPTIIMFVAANNNIEIANAIHNAGESYSSLTAGKTSGIALLLILSGLSWMFGYTGQPQLLTRLMAINSKKDYNAGKWVAAIWTVFAYTGALLIGYIGFAFVKDGFLGNEESKLAEDCEKILPVMINYFMAPLLAGLLLSGAISAMMSTASSEIIVSSSSITEDIVGNLRKKTFSPKSQLWFNRLITLAVGIAAFILALTVKDSIYGLVSYAWSGIGSSFGPALLLILFWKKVSRAGVIASLICGTTGTIIWKIFLQTSTGVSERLTSFFFALIMAIIFSLLLPESRFKKAAT